MGVTPNKQANPNQTCGWTDVLGVAKSTRRSVHLRVGIQRSPGLKKSQSPSEDTQWSWRHVGWPIPAHPDGNPAHRLLTAQRQGQHSQRCPFLQDPCPLEGRPCPSPGLTSFRLPHTIIWRIGFYALLWEGHRHSNQRCWSQNQFPSRGKTGRLRALPEPQALKEEWKASGQDPSGALL